MKMRLLQISAIYSAGQESELDRHLHRARSENCPSFGYYRASRFSRIPTIAFVNSGRCRGWHSRSHVLRYSPNGHPSMLEFQYVSKIAGEGETTNCHPIANAAPVA